MAPRTRGFPRGGGGNAGPLDYEADGGKWETIRGHFVAASGEFVGTVMFLYFSFGGTQVAAMTSQNNTMDPQRLLFISLSFGMSLLVVAWTFYRVSGGLFNPAVSFLGTGSHVSSIDRIDRSFWECALLALFRGQEAPFWFPQSFLELSWLPH